MRPPTSSSSLREQANTSLSRSKKNAFILVTAVFFMWGFITTLNDVLVPHLKASFYLNYTESLFIQFTFFGAYFILGAPAGWLVSKIGYRNSIIVGLLITSFGALMFWPAANLHIYSVFLSALFILAGGITLLQVSANPYVGLLGPEKTASSRLNLAQMFNSLGTTIAPWLGGFLILSGNVLNEKEFNTLTQIKKLAYMSNQARSVQGPYLSLAIILIVVAIMFYFLHPKSSVDLGKNTSSADNHRYSFIEALKYRRVKLGALSIFLYVGAEVAIGSFLISFIVQPHVGNMSHQSAAYYLSYYWGSAMLGRGISSWLLRIIEPGKLLAIFSIIAASLVSVSMSTYGMVAMWALVLVGFFNSIMFPTIFSLATSRLGPITPKASSIMIMAIVGGAFIPLLQGLLADSSVGLNRSLILPVLCYIFIMYYGFSGSQIKENN